MLHLPEKLSSLFFSQCAKNSCRESQCRKKTSRSSLGFSGGVGSEGLATRKVIANFEKAYPNIKVKVLALSSDADTALQTINQHFIAGDGRVYLNRHNDRYDLILLDAFRELGIPFQMLTREFYTLVNAHLAPGGAMASNLAANTKLYLSTLVTLRAVFPTVDIYPEWKDASESQAIVVAQPAPRPAE